MDAKFYIENRKNLFSRLESGSAVVLFSGAAPRKTADENYPFFASRHFVYLTGIDREGLVYFARKTNEAVEERLFILPPDLLAERWTGSRIKADEVAEKSGITNCAYVSEFDNYIKSLAEGGKFEYLYLDFDKRSESEPDSPAYVLAHRFTEKFPYIIQKNVHNIIADLRTIKRECEIEAMRRAELITRDGIIAMMRASKPGMYEYQYKAEYDYVLAQNGVLAPMFPSIISAGKNNFCIHYYDYRGIAQDGDMVLNDVGAMWDFHGTDVSRGWPCNGKFSDRQKALYECAYATSNYMFSILKPGIPMKDVDLIARKYDYELLHNLGLIDKYENAGKLIWHGGAHHVGLDTHDVVSIDDRLTEPGMVFCVDIGIYCEEWGIGFRLEDNCLITQDGCENLSAVTPRSIEDIEAIMRG